jgi:K+-sensing histidine kinase KdpD
LRVYGDKQQIPVAARDSIFDPYGGHLHEKPAHAAHRVGLALAKVIVEVHHGSIWIEDTPSAGTAFVIEFPAHWTSRGLRSSE